VPTSQPPLIQPGRDSGQELLELVTTAMFEIVEGVAPVIARQMIARVPALGPLDDEQALEATRRSALGSMYELLCITRAGLNGPGVIETSPEALEHLRFLKRRGAGFKTVMGFYRIGFAMFAPLMDSELNRLVPDRETYKRMADPMRTFIFTYVDQVTRRLAVEYGIERDDWVPDPADLSWHDPESVDVIRRYIEAVAERGRPAGDGAAARRYTAWALDRFWHAMAAAADDPQLSSVLSRANTTVRIQLADDPDLGMTLLLDRDPIELVDEAIDAEVSLSIVSVDLARLYSSDFHLPMAILRGRVGYGGASCLAGRDAPSRDHADLRGVNTGWRLTQRSKPSPSSTRRHSSCSIAPPTTATSTTRVSLTLPSGSRASSGRSASRRRTRRSARTAS
jgi:hypothetical protein